MFRCCKPRKRTYTFKNGSRVDAKDYSEAIEKLKKAIKNDDPSGWIAYLDYKLNNLDYVITYKDESAE
jgi:hypothetical protein